MNDLEKYGQGAEVSLSKRITKIIMYHLNYRMHSIRFILIFKVVQWQRSYTFIVGNFSVKQTPIMPKL